MDDPNYLYCKWDKKDIVRDGFNILKIEKGCNLTWKLFEQLMY